MTKPLPDRLLLASPNERSYVPGRYDPEITYLYIPFGRL